MAREDFSIKEGDNIDWTTALKISDERKEEIRQTKEYKDLMRLVSLESKVLESQDLQELDINLKELEDFLKENKIIEITEIILLIKNELETVSEKNREFVNEIKARHGKEAAEFVSEIHGGSLKEKRFSEAKVMPFNKK